MIGVILSSLGSLFEEVSSSIGKYEIRQKKESIYTLGFLNVFWSTLFFLLLVLSGRESFVFAAASLPTFLLRAFLEVFQGYATIQALVRADRTTFSFVRSGTIPLLLLVDMALGYPIGVWQFTGISVIVLALLIAFAEHDLDRQGLNFVIFSALNSVFTIALFKYNVSHFNSVAGEQIIMSLIFLVLFLILAWKSAGENPFTFLRHRTFFAQSATHGLATVAGSFAISFVPASVAVAAGRASGILWSTLAGHRYFAERHFTAKLALGGMLAVGILLLAF
jgi:hypothetical protein